MPDSILRIVVDLQNASGAKLGTLAADLKGVGTAADGAAPAVTAVGEAATGAAAGTGDLGASAQDSGLKLTELHSAVSLVREGVQTMQAVYDQTAGKALAWGETVDKLTRASGESATETSRMAVVFGDFGIQADSLDMTIRALTKQGLQFNMETIQSLAAQYQALPDAVSRNEFAFKNFGRSGLELNEILTKTPAELQALGEQADYSGKVINDTTVAALQAAAVKTQQFNDKVDGLKIAIGGPMVDVLMAAADAETLWIKSMIEAGIALMAQTGLITWDEAATRAAAVAKGDYAAGMRGVTEAATALGPPIEKSAGYTAALAAAQDAANFTLNNAAGLVATYTGQLDPLANAQHAAALSAFELDKAQTAANLSRLIAAGLAGTVGKNEQTYAAVIDGNADKIAKLRAEIAKYSAAQGQAYTIVTDAKYSQDEYALATERARLATQKLTDYTGDDTLKLLELKVAAGDAAGKVDDMGKAMGTTVTGTADYSTKIAADQAALDLLTGANSRAEDAMHKANREFAIQQAAAGLTGQALLSFELAMGTIDQPTYDATLALQAANAEYLKTGDLSAYESATRNIIDTMNGVAPVVNPMPAILQDAAGAFATAGTAADLAASQVKGLNDMMLQVHDVHATITVNTIQTGSASANSGHNYVDANGVYHYAQGGSFVVPPGYGNDTYPLGPNAMASSGETVTVTPAGQGRAGGGDTTIYNINDKLAMALAASDARQRKLAALNGYMA